MKDRSTVIWNKHAYNAGTLLSRHHLPHVLQHRQESRYEGVVGSLNKWVDEVRVSTKESVPYFDPRSATQGADVLVLLQDPSGEAQLGSGFISRDNNDPTAHNSTLAAEAGGLPYSRSLHWNVVPWWVANPAFPPRTLAAEARRAAPLLAELMELLESRPKVVLLLGKQAQTAWSQLLLSASLELKSLPAILGPHPSPLAYNKTDAVTGKPNKELLREAFARAAAMSK
ncbi:uracil-DNA glycosylase family protein [Pseudarthrobacter sp. AL07]|uniref:uracil-DNA glycosylase family protein n=1 Tax=unclassified Pseudarthrobacter TaxID=2647000 RepID=UPI00249C0841|nr:MULTISPECIES: uracil-DNA glycosylase family protein [unclassified Pseudarthrobacter]MDI3195407.1 uracil-DNA glycosylase family protein [Pseudarthrobacter sp. AL20]MDI3209473.1 uracil-DNA glycosylase family protein [Pseudarthrobacter sp. AL07]